jgi:hypothetical protein
MNIGRPSVREKVQIQVDHAVRFSFYRFGKIIYMDGLVRAVNEKSYLIKYWDEGVIREIQIPHASADLAEWLIGDWWRDIINAEESERVLGDKDYIDEVAPLKIDAIGRGKKGFGHGSIDMKPVRRKRKSGRIWESKQAWYQWEDESGKHCRYLRKGVDLTVQRLIDEGATVEMILESIGKSKDSSKGKTR